MNDKLGIKIEHFVYLIFQDQLRYTTHGDKNKTNSVSKVNLSDLVNFDHSEQSKSVCVECEVVIAARKLSRAKQN